MSLAKLPLAAVMGDPVLHSLSPRLHGHWLHATQSAGSYIPLHVTPENFEQVLRAMPKMGFVGTNVTLPHKQTALHLVDDLSARAKAIGAVNTISFLQDEAGRHYVHGDNTDAYGFLAHLQQSAPTWLPAGSALILGAGGAARAIIYALLGSGVKKLIIANRTFEKAKALADDFGVDAIEWRDVEACLETVSLFVNTTSLGMKGQPALNVSLKALPAQAVVYDIVYTPLQTPLLKAAHERGCQSVDGLGMLLHQGVPGFERWFGIRPQVDEATRLAVLK